MVILLYVLALLANRIDRVEMYKGMYSTQAAFQQFLLHWCLFIYLL